MIEGKEEFYKKAEEALKKSGYQYYGEKDIPGITGSRLRRGFLELEMIKALTP